MGIALLTVLLLLWLWWCCLCRRRRRCCCCRLQYTLRMCARESLLFARLSFWCCLCLWCIYVVSHTYEHTISGRCARAHTDAHAWFTLLHFTLCYYLIFCNLLLFVRSLVRSLDFVVVVRCSLLWRVTRSYFATLFAELMTVCGSDGGVLHVALTNVSHSQTLSTHYFALPNFWMHNKPTHTHSFTPLAFVRKITPKQNKVAGNLKRTTNNHNTEQAPKLRCFLEWKQNALCLGIFRRSNSK